MRGAMKIIDDNTKRLHWWNRNFFYVVTVAVVLVNIILYGVLGNNWEQQFKPDSSWYSTLNFTGFVRGFLNSFSHENWQHVLLNMLCFLICGLYLERKTGSLPFLGLVFVLTLFSALSTPAYGLYWHGFSGANYALYGYIIVDYPFTFRKRTRTKFNIIAGAVMLALIYFAACFNGGMSGVGFAWYPYDFMTNMGHYSGFVVGLVIGLLVQICCLIARREERR